MPHIIIKKWIEPYVLLETLKSNYVMKEFVFDGFSKKSIKNEFFAQLNAKDTFGLYMKNVNKFYVFKGDKTLDIENLFGFTPADYVFSEDCEEVIYCVDAGKAEAGIIIF